MIGLGEPRGVQGELHDERGPVAGAVADQRPDGHDVPDPGDDQDAERGPGDLVEPAGRSPDHVGAEPAQYRDERGQGELADGPSDSESVSRTM